MRLCACSYSQHTVAATVLTSEAAYSYEQHLLSRYSDGDPEDDNALYETLLSLRLAHVPAEEAKKDIGIDVRQGLFSPVDHFEDELHAEDGWQSLLCQGFGTVLDMVSI